MTVPIPFAGGVETQIDPKRVEPARLLDLQNGVFTPGGSIAKRNGYTSLSQTVEGTGATYADARALARRDLEVMLLTDRRAYSYRPDADRWSDTGAVSSVIETSEPLARTGTTQSVPDVATLAGVSAVAWEDSRGGVWWATVETATGRILRAAAQAHATAQRPRCVATGTVLHLYYAVAAESRVYVMVINPADPTAAAVAAVLIDDLDAANPTYDAEPTPRTGTPAAIGWARTGGGWRAGYVDASGVLGSPASGHPSVLTNAAATLAAGVNLCISYENERPSFYVVHYDGANVSAMQLDPDTMLLDSTATTAPGGTVVRLAAVGLTATADVVVAAERSAATARDHSIVISTPFSGTVSATQRGAALASRAFRDDAIAHVVVVHETTYFPVYLTLELTSAGARVVTRTLPGLASGRPVRAHLPSVQVDEDDARVWRWPATYREQLDSENGDQFGEVGIRWIRLDFDSAAAWQTAQLGRGLYLAGSCPLHYDGDRWAELGFHYGADAVTGVASAGGSLSASEAYTYRVVYEEIDAQGEIHQGPTSVGTRVTLGGGDSRVTLTIPTYRATSKRRVRIGVFRTEGNGEAVYYRVSSLNPAATGSNGYVANDTTVDTVSFVDDLADGAAGLLAREPLYTNGGILSNDPAAWSGAFLAAGKNRLFFGDALDAHVVRFTQERAEGYGVEAPADLAIRVDPHGGPLVGAAVMDDVVAAFCETAIYVFGGPGPLPNPNADSNASFTPPRLVPSADDGLKAARSIGYTPAGLIFQGRRGIGLLGRELQVAPIGGTVEGYDDQTVSRTTLLPDRTQIVLLTADGRSLLFDYDQQQWSTFTNHEGLDSIVVAGRYYYLRTDGRVFRETPGEYRDDNSHIQLVLEMAWIKFAGFLQGWQRVWYAQFLGTYKSAHDLMVRYALDYEAGWSPPITLDVAANYDPDAYGEGAYGSGDYGGSASTSTVYQRRVHIGKRCQAIRFRIEDIEAATDFGASFELSELVLTGGVLPKPFKLGAARSD